MIALGADTIFPYGRYLWPCNLYLYYCADLNSIYGQIAWRLIVPPDISGRFVSYSVEIIVFLIFWKYLASLATLATLSS